jgi:hypothetical protein
MRSIVRVTVVWCLVWLFAAVTFAQDSTSGPLARELSTLLAGRNLSAIATQDPERPDRFVAAVVFPVVQLIVIAARYATPTVLEDQLAKRQYNDVYGILQQASTQDSRVFFQDLKADGLHAKPGAAVDVMYERVVDQTIFDGAPEKRKVSEAAYLEKFRSADALYSRLLTLLIAEVKNAGTPP